MVREDQSVVLIDFGLARSLTANHVRGIFKGITAGRGTPFYRPPESMRPDYDPSKFDVYSLGKVILFLLLGPDF